MQIKTNSDINLVKGHDHFYISDEGTAEGIGFQFGIIILGIEYQIGNFHGIIKAGSERKQKLKLWLAR